MVALLVVTSDMPPPLARRPLSFGLLSLISLSPQGFLVRSIPVKKRDRPAKPSLPKQSPGARVPSFMLNRLIEAENVRHAAALLLADSRGPSRITRPLQSGATPSIKQPRYGRAHQGPSTLGRAGTAASRSTPDYGQENAYRSHSPGGNPGCGTGRNAS